MVGQQAQTSARLHEWWRKRLRTMIGRSLTRRLERLEAELAPSDDEPALTIVVTSVGQPDKIIEVHGTKTADQRRRPWSLRRVFEKSK
jgi:hypothetical protein